MENIYTNSSAVAVPIDGAVAGLIGAILGGLLLFMLAIVLLIYIYMAICLVKIAKKTKTNNAWFAWIPILNIILIVQCSQKPMWWIILFFIPLVNIVAMVIVWMAIAKNLGKPDWLGILMIVPVANLILPGYLAFSKNEPSAPVIPPTIPVNPV